jgi:mannose/fructose/N-acetylgalactosamine-specific phosphotransferase system component IIC
MNLPVGPRMAITVTLGGLAALDATPVAQTFLSQPLVTGTLLGVLWGDLRTALQVAVVLQILAASTVPVGARTPEDYATGAVIGVASTLALSNGHTFTLTRDACAMLGVMIGLVTAVIGSGLLRWQRRLNEGLSRWCEERLRRGEDGALAAAQRAAVVLAFGVGVAYCAVCLVGGVAGLAHVASSESLWLARAWRLAQPLWLGLGLAQILHAFVQRRLARISVFGAALIVAWLANVVGTP